MIYGIGTDIIEVSRMEKALGRTESLRGKLFAKEEQVYCEGNAIRYQHYAARFAAKEAFFKALGTGFRYGMAFNEIVVSNDDLGKPVIQVKGKVAEYCTSLGITAIHLSLAHIKETAVAFVLLEK